MIVNKLCRLSLAGLMGIIANGSFNQPTQAQSIATLSEEQKH